MPYINLIEVHRIAERREARGLRIGFLALGATGAIALLAFGTLFFQKESRAGEARALQANVERMKPLQAEIARAEKERGGLAPRLKTLSDAQSLTGRWARILDHLATNTPAATWLTAVRSSAAADAPISLSVAGVGRTQADAAEFMMRAQNARDLENVQLRYTQEKLLNATSAIEFEVGGDIVETAPPKVVRDAPTGGGA